MKDDGRNYFVKLISIGAENYLVIYCVYCECNYQYFTIDKKVISYYVFFVNTLGCSSDSSVYENGNPVLFGKICEIKIRILHIEVN